MSKKLWTGRNRWIIGGATGLLIVGGSAAIATAAFADDGDDANESGNSQVADNDDDRDDDGDDKDGDDDTAPTSKPKTSLADAAATASDEVNKGILTSIELEGSDKAPVWRVDFITSNGTEHEVTVDGSDGKVTDHNKEADNDTGDWDEAKAANDQAKTSPEDAATAALDKVGKSGTVTSVELDDDTKSASWDVDVTTDKGEFKSVSVDAANGKVTDVYTDDDDNDGDDDSDDQDDNDTDDNDGDND